MGLPLGVGYPGWHIECSCISMKHLGEDLDIHCGGIDNAFPITPTKLPRARHFWGISGAITGSMCTI